MQESKKGENNGLATRKNRITPAGLSILSFRNLKNTEAIVASLVRKGLGIAKLLNA